MTETVTAVFNNGALYPEQPLHLLGGARVRLVVEPLAQEQDPIERAIDEFDALCDEITISSTEAHLTREQLHDRS